jgi:hypothetical protein
MIIQIAYLINTFFNKPFEIVWLQCLNIHNNLTNRGFVFELWGGLIELGPLAGWMKNYIS